jgi:hypothetical protein
MLTSLRSSFFTFALVLAVVFRSAPAAAEESAAERANDRGVPLMALGAALFTTSYGISLAIGVTATAEYVTRCPGSGPRPLGEAIACLDSPATMHLMVPIAGPFQTLAESRHADAADRALLVADGVAQIAGVVLAGIGMAQYIDQSRARRPPPAKSAVRVVPSGAGVVVLGTF